MDRQISHPTKEQVRAYMARREAAHRPPPPPDEIRRQLNWRLTPADNDNALLRFCLLPATCAHLSVQVLLDWLFPAAGQNSAARPPK